MAEEARPAPDHARIAELELAVERLQRSLGNLQESAQLPRTEATQPVREVPYVGNNYYFGPTPREGGGGEANVLAASPVGTPSEQAWSFSLSDPKIQGTETAYIPTSDCVELVSAVVEKGEAVFVLRCKKDANGKCKDCSATVNLNLSPSSATKQVTVTCKPT